MIKKLLLVGMLFFHTDVKSKIVIWDLGGVLCFTSKKGMAQEALSHMGLMNVLSYIVWDWRLPTTIKKIAFDILHQVEKPGDENYKCALTPDGEVLPYIHCQFQAGKYKETDPVEKVYKYIDELPETTFASAREKYLVKQVVKVMFDVDILARNTALMRQGIALLKEIAEARNEDGSFKHTCIALSNWDPSSFKKFAEVCHDVFLKYFQGRLEISGETGHMKPNAEAYMALCTKYNVKPQDCIFIDDLLINVEAARQLGIDAIHLKDGDFFTLQQELSKRSIF
jgi:FMN phosphatase YigB (HAD superfamily)